MTISEFHSALDASSRRRHNDRGFLYMLLAKLVAGDEAAEWPEYQGPEEGQDDEEDLYEQIERDLMASPFIRHVDNRTPEQRAADEARALEEEPSD